MGQSPARALIVEDDLLLNRVFNDMVADMGFAVTATNDADGARRALRDGDYQIIMTDLNLRGDIEAGLTLANELCQQRCSSRIVLISGHPEPLALQPEISFLQKPFTVAQLQGILDVPAMSAFGKTAAAD